MQKILLARTDDWVALIIDGKIVDQGHDLRTEDVIRILTGIEPEVTWIPSDDVGKNMNEFLKKYK